MNKNRPDKKIRLTKFKYIITSHLHQQTGLYRYGDEHVEQEGKHGNVRVLGWERHSMICLLWTKQTKITQREGKQVR